MKTMENALPCGNADDANQRDLMGEFVDGEYWGYLEETLRRDAETLTGKPRVILDRLVATVDDVPAQLIKEQQGPWNDMEFEAESVPFARVHEEMIEEIVRGEYAPESATLFAMEYIRRLTGGRGS